MQQQQQQQRRGALYGSINHRKVRRYISKHSVSGQGKEQVPTRLTRACREQRVAGTSRLFTAPCCGCCCYRRHRDTQTSFSRSIFPHASSRRQAIAAHFDFLFGENKSKSARFETQRCAPFSQKYKETFYCLNGSMSF